MRSLRRDDGVWFLSSPHGDGHVADSLGMRQLARLLAAPGSELAAVDLVGAEKGREVVVASDLGPALDARAKREYRRRISELQAEIEEAEDHNDPERAAKHRIELDALLDELRAAVGLGGRDRPQGSGAEKARINVSRNVRRAIAVGRHRGPRPRRPPAGVDPHRAPLLVLARAGRRPLLGRRGRVDLDPAEETRARPEVAGGEAAVMATVVWGPELASIYDEVVAERFAPEVLGPTVDVLADARRRRPGPGAGDRHRAGRAAAGGPRGGGARHRAVGAHGRPAAGQARRRRHPGGARRHGRHEGRGRRSRSSTWSSTRSRT